jgi:hypothetical protein
VTRYFGHFPGPHSYLLPVSSATTPEQQQSGTSQQEQQQQTQHVQGHELAFASLLGLQLLPELRKAWGAGPFLDLLLSEDVAVRWVAVQALGILLGLVGLCICAVHGSYTRGVQPVIK